MDTSQAWYDLLEWFSDGTQISYKKGEIVLRPEDSPRDIFLVETGIMKAYELTKNGDQNIRNFKQTDDIFPIIWVMRPEKRNTYYEVIADAVVRRKSRKALMEYIEQQPNGAFALLGQFTDMYIEYAERINNLEFRYARERIAYRLVSLAETFGEKTKLGVQIKLPIRQIELADSTNVTRETASRELLRLKKKGIISYNDTTYTVIDMGTLQREYS